MNTKKTRQSVRKLQLDNICRSFGTINWSCFFPFPGLASRATVDTPSGSGRE